MFGPRRVSSLLAFCFSLFMSFTTAGAVDLDPTTHQAVPGDFNGDGRLDALMQPLVETGQGGILLQDGTGNLTVVAQGWDPGYLGLDWSVDKSVVTAADLNGDGLDDVVVQPRAAGKNASVLITDPTVQLLNVVQVIPVNYLGLDWSSAGHLIVPGDFDGDHQKELLLQAVSAGAPSAIVHADQFGHLVAITQPIPSGYLGRRWDANDVTLYVGDLNGDGRQDLLMQVKAGAQKAGESAYALLLADENGQFTQISQVWNTNDMGADWSPATHTLSLQDVNGSGVMSIVLTAKDASGTNYVFQPSAQGTLSKPAAKWTGPSTARDVMAKQSAGGKGISVVVTPGATGKAQQLNAAATTNSPAGMTMSLVTGNSLVTPTAFGTMGGQSGVEGGSASYSIPIAVPPGIAGMQPSLSLNYSSQGGNGEAGFGWSLSGASAIHRCPSTYAQDGYDRGVTYGESNLGVTLDRLCLDGQHLIAVSGVYGRTSSVYRTERDSMVRVTLTGSMDSASASFEVDYQDGRKSVYGSSGTAFTATGAPYPLVWAIKQTYDPAGNNVVYDYQGFGNGEYHLGDIKYTGSTSTSGAIASTGNREVDFTYSQRTDLNSTYLAGGRTDQTEILTQITTMAGGTEVNQYSLNYSPSVATGRSLLRSVQECGVPVGGNTPCLPADTFTWKEPALQYTDPSVITVPAGIITGSGNDSSTGSQVTAFYSSSDYDGDGENELFYDYSDGFAFSPSGSVQIDLGAVFQGPNYLGSVEDFMRNGLAEPLGQTNSTTPELLVAICTYKTTCATKDNYSLPIHTGIFKGGPSVWVTGDFTGDGLPDVVAEKDAGLSNPAIYLYANKTGKNDTVPTFDTTGVKLADLSPVGNCLVYGYQTFAEIGDMDGDGTPDLMLTQSCPEGLPVAIAFVQNLPSGTTATVKSLSSIGIVRDLTQLNYYFADINGDGLKDFVFTSQGGGDWYYQINKGGTFAPEQDTGVIGVSNDPNTGEALPLDQVKVGDFTGEGRDEFMVPVEVTSRYCEANKVYDPEAQQWVTQEVCGGLGSQDYSFYKFQILKFVEQANGIYVPTWVTGAGNTIVSLKAEARTTSIGDLDGSGITGLVMLATTWFSNGSFNRANEVGGCTIGVAPCETLPVSLGNYYSMTLPSGASDLMTSAVNGLGAQASWAYDALSHLVGSGAYVVDTRPCGTATALNTGSMSEYYCFGSSMWVVSSYSVSNGISGINSYTYQYTDAVYEDEGRGFQGFKSITVNDLAASTQTINTYRQDFPFSGLLAESKVYAISGTTTTLLSDTTNLWPTLPASPTACLPSTKVFWAELSKSTVIKNNADGSLMSTTITAYGYDGYGNTTSVSATTTDPTGTYSTSTADTFGAPDCTDWWTDAPSLKTVTSTVSYNPTASLPTPPTEPQITRTAAYPVYDTILRKVKTEKDDQGASFEKDIAYTYDAFGNTQTVTVSTPDALPFGTLNTAQDYGFASKVTRTDYTVDGYFVNKITDPMGHITLINPDTATGQPAIVTDPNLVVTTYTYDAFGRKNSEQIAGASLAQYTYAAIYSECPSNDAYSYYIYQPGYPTKITCNDILGRVNLTLTAGFQYGNDVYQATMYDALGRVHKASEPYLNSDYSQTSPPYCNQSPHYCTVYTYDVLNRVTDKLDAKGVDAKYAYDTQNPNESAPNPLETQIVVTPPDSPAYTTYETHNSLGKMLSTLDANSSETDFRYDAAGNPVFIQDAANNQTVATFNILGQKTAITDPDMGTWTYAYDVLGELLQQTDAKSQQITMTYDLGGRMTSKVQPEGTTNWTYDSCTKGIGKLCNVTQYDGYSETDSYDQNGRLTSTDEKIKNVDYVTSTAYDTDGRVGTITYPATIMDAAPAVTSLTANGASSATVLVNDPPVTLAGAANDADLTATTPTQYQWSVSSTTCGCTPSLSSTTGTTTQFTPAVPGIYTFKLTASDGLQATSSTVIVNVQPQAPGTLSTNESYSYDGTFAVNWSAATGSSSYNPSYNLYQSINGGAYSKLACATCAQLTQAFTGMGSQTSNITYTYKATASANGVEGPTGNTVSIPVYFVPTEPVPHTLPTQSTGSRTFAVSWTASAGVTPSYTVKTALVPDQGLQPIWAKGSCTGSGTSCTVTETADGSYEAEVFSCNQLTCNAPEVAPGSVNVWHFTPPAAPTALGVTYGSGNNITLSWTAPSLQPGAIATYEIFNAWATKTGPLSAWTQVGTSSTTSFATTDPLTRYSDRFYVVACNQAGCGANSAVLIITNDQTGGGGGCQTCIQTNPTSAPGSGTTAAPAPASIARTEGVPPPIGPVPVEVDPGTLALLAVQSIAPVRDPKLAAEVHGASTRTFDFAPPVYKAYAGAHLEAVTSTSTLVGVTVQYSYNNDGYLSKIINNANPNQVYWKATGMNARGQVTDEQYGLNGTAATVTSHRDYYPESGYVENIQSTNNSGTTLQSMHYDWQELGNLADRQSMAQPGVTLSETFGYDILNRVTSAQVTNGNGAQPALGYTYDALGNITTKSDVSASAYVYGGVTNAGPHAVTSIPGVGSYGYDPNGNMTNRAGTNIGWNSDNLPTGITQDANNSSQFNYAPDKHRVYQTAMVNGLPETTVYAGGLEIVTDSSGNLTHNRYQLSAYGRTVAIVDLETASNAPVINEQFVLSDHLGSMDVATDATGAVVGGTGWNFEAFGKRRDAASWQGPANSTQTMSDRTNGMSNGIASGVTHRGHTGHEMLDNVGLVHMNGRIYDPMIGRMLSVDPVFQFPTNTQSLNPYTYALNNPLSLTDPTGYNTCDISADKSCLSSGVNTVINADGSKQTVIVADKGDQIRFTDTKSGLSLKVTVGDNGVKTFQPTAILQRAASEIGNVADRGKDDPVHAAANASNCAYDGVCKLPSGYQATDSEWYSQHGQDAGLYNKVHAEAFASTTGGGPIVAYRGTANLDDLGTDARQALAGGGAQYAAAIALAQGVRSAFGDNALLTGHSLGGGEASAGALVTGLRAITFNAAGVNSNTLSPYNVNMANAPALIKAYYIRGDILTTLQSFTSLPGAIGTPMPINPTFGDAIQGPLHLHSMSSVLDGLGNN